MSSPTPYEQIGGAEVVEQLVDRFYDHMDTLEAAAAIRAMHPEDLGESREKLKWFLSGWLGGPPLYWERRGHPRLRRRHMPFAIDASAAAAWMRCMKHALDEVVDDADLRVELFGALAGVARHMINR